MPVHEWTKVDAGLFHDFHQRWTVSLCDALNDARLPHDFFALIEQSIRGPVPDLLTLKLAPSEDEGSEHGRGSAVVTAPPRTRFSHRTEAQGYLKRPIALPCVTVMARSSPSSRSYHQATRRAVRPCGTLSRRPRTSSIKGFTCLSSICILRASVTLMASQKRSGMNL
jgi:hypothetical protein